VHVDPPSLMSIAAGSLPGLKRGAARAAFWGAPKRLQSIQEGTARAGGVLGRPKTATKHPRRNCTSRSAHRTPMTLASLAASPERRAQLPAHHPNPVSGIDGGPPSLTAALEGTGAPPWGRRRRRDGDARHVFVPVAGGRKLPIYLTVADVSSGRGGRE